MLILLEILMENLLTPIGRGHYNVTKRIQYLGERNGASSRA